MKTTTHILGMAKTPMDSKGSKPRNLELDFFKLAFAVAKLRASGDHAYGYLQVIAPKLETRIKHWVQKYQTADVVQVLFYTPTQQEKLLLEKEKSDNASGNAKKGVSLVDGRTASDASYSRDLGEKALHDSIRMLHPKSPKHVKRPNSDMPAGTQWDYYGMLPSEG